MDIRLTDGILVESKGGTYLVDGTPTNNETAIISHSHADHLPGRTTESYICSDLTHAIGSARIGSFDMIESADDIQLIDSGHIIGSKSVLISDEEELTLVTGDFNTRDTMATGGFSFTDSVTNSVTNLVIETTYGHPRYQFPDQNKLQSDIISWINSNQSSPIVCSGYSLGRAQEINLLVQESSVDTIYVNPATRKIHQTINSNSDYSFSTKGIESLTELGSGNLYITSNRDDVIQARKELPDVKTAVFTGWALDGRYKNSDLFDRSFPVSDHADYNGLIETVKEIDPEQVYTMHGYKDRFANEVVSETGVSAMSLKRSQHTLSDFR